MCPLGLVLVANTTWGLIVLSLKPLPEEIVYKLWAYLFSFSILKYCWFIFSLGHLGLFMDSVAPGALRYKRRSHSNNKNADDKNADDKEEMR